jgi:hypothetical protein
MNHTVEILISVVIVVSLTLFLSRSIKLSARYERKPHKLSDWNAQDKGIDPTLDIESDR